jgi:hypothetical protein
MTIPLVVSVIPCDRRRLSGHVASRTVKESPRYTFSSIFESRNNPTISDPKGSNPGSTLFTALTVTATLALRQADKL